MTDNKNGIIHTYGLKDMSEKPGFTDTAIYVIYYLIYKFYPSILGKNLGFTPRILNLGLSQYIMGK